MLTAHLTAQVRVADIPGLGQLPVWRRLLLLSQVQASLIHNCRVFQLNPIKTHRLAIVTTLRSPVPGNYFGHYEQFFRQRLGEDGGQQGAGQGAEQELYRRWMSDTDISSGSECVEAASTRVNISHSQDIPDSDPADSGHGDSVFFSAKLAAGGSVESDQSGSVQDSASKRSIRRFVIMDKASTRAFSWLKAATTAFTFKTLLRHYAK